MANDDRHVPLDEWLVNSRDPERDPPRAPTVDEVHRLAQSLDPDERLRLAARLWSGLPQSQRATLVSLQLEDGGNPRTRYAQSSNRASNGAKKRGFWDPPFDGDNATKLYSAPRRFDLATIFVVTAAFSLLLGGLTALDAPPVVKITISGFVTVIAVAQALLQKVVNPRASSIVAGAIACTLSAWCIWLIFPRIFPGSLIVYSVIIAMLGGTLGYLAGTLVGGVFLVADVVRGKFEGRGVQVTESPDATHITQLSDEDIYE
jgi:hypothetical protein